jgi:hypothetical protein
MHIRGAGARAGSSRCDPGSAILPILKDHHSMKTHFKSAGLGALLVLLMAGGVAGGVTTASAAAAFPLGSSPEIPAAQGDVRLQTTRNGNVELKLHIMHLAPPGHIVPGTEVFVVWARGLAAGSVAQNLGALRVDRNLNGRFTTVTAMQSFDLFITCEQSQTAIAPSGLELLPFHHPSR